MKSLLRPFEPWVSGLHCNSGGKMAAASNVAKSRDLKNCHNNQVVGGSGHHCKCLELFLKNSLHLVG